MANRLLCAFVALLLSTTLFGQPTQFSPDFSWREYTGVVTPPLCPDKLCHFYPTNSFESAYKEFAAWRGLTANSATDFMNFRVAFPLNYNVTRPEKYPVILMLHGAGESGRIWSGNFDYLPSDPRYDNNSRNLLHGGNVHQQAANRVATHPQAFPGIIIFPQVSYSGSWASGWQEEPTTNQEFIYEFLEWMVLYRNADINRIYVHGLSNGGRGTWDTATKRPDLFAAALPMSGLPYNSEVAAARLETTPIRLYQGGTDTNPSPGGAESMIDKLVANGGNPQYILFPTLGHGVWNTAYGQADFWSWMLSKNKLNIYIFGGGTELCPGLTNTKRLGFSYGYTSYQWKKNGVAIPDSTSRYLTIVGDGDYTGSYTVDFTRPNGTTGTSNPVVITGPIGGGYTPALTVGSGSMIHPFTKENGALIGGSVTGVETRIEAPTGYSEYRWYKNDFDVNDYVTTSTSNTYFLGQGSNATIQGNVGIWRVSVKESSGCYSNLSDPLTLIYNTGAHQYPAGTSNGEYYTSIGRPTAVAVPGFSNKMLVTWTDNAPEEFFEIWRERRGSNGYLTQGWNVIAVLPANTTSFVDDIGIRPNAQYNYSIRAMANNDGRFSQKTLTSPSYPTSNQDNDAPTTPSQITASNITQNSITLSWAPSIDNDVVWAYEVYNGTTLVATLTEIPQTPPGDLTDGNPHPPTTYTFTGLDQGTTYMLNVRAVDFRQNKSDFSQGAVATTLSLVNGVTYNYFKFINTTYAALASPKLTNFDWDRTVTSSGVVNNMNNVVQTIDNGDFYFVDFNAYIDIHTAGIYRFYTDSDDGARLYIDGNLIVNGDFDQGSGAPESGVTPTALTVGLHTIRVQFYENTGGNVLLVRYKLGATDAYGSATTIPNGDLYRIGTPTLTHYYSGASGNLQDLTTWWSNSNGTGSNPLNFTTANRVFHLNRNAILTTPWIVSGSNSYLVVSNNATLALNEALTAKLSAEAGSTITLNHTTFPNFQNLHATSTVNMNIDGVVPQTVYGNLNLNTAATIKTLPFSSTIVNGNLAVADDVIFEGSSTSRSTLTVAGNIIFSGSSGSVLDEGQRYSLILDGNVAHTISVNQADIALAGLEVEGTLNLNFNDANQHTLTVGVPNSSGGLLLRSGAMLQLGNHNLEVNGTSGVNPTDDSGEININGGNITVATASGQTSSLYFSDEENTHNVNNLSLTNTGAGQINIAGQTKLANQLTVGSGNTINMQGDFVLRSTSDGGTGTARIGPLLNGASIVGNITAERFMSGEGKIYRYISSPVANATVEQLQAAFPITGNFTGTSTNYPAPVTTNTSMWGYSEPNYTPFPSNGGSNQQILERGKGYSAFIREGVTSTTWAVTGVPHQGDVLFTLTGTNGVGDTGWNLLGNPYAAPIKWTGGSTGGWTLSGVSNTIYVRENSGATTLVKSHNGAVGTNGWDGVIAQGQAFWVRTTSLTPTLSVNENAKQITDGAFYREGAPDNVLEIKMKSATAQDATLIQFSNEATPAFDTNLDGVKLDNSFFNISTLSSDNKAMVINQTTTNYCEQDVKLRISNATNGNYELEIAGGENIISGDEITFTDNFTNTQFTIAAEAIYAFSITADAASKADGRFTLRFKKPEVTLNQSLKSYPACEADSPLILVTNSQPGVTYQAFHNGIPVTEAFTSLGGTLEIPGDKDKLSFGTTEVTIKAGFKGCNTFELPITILVQRDTLATPEIIVEPTQLIASTADAQYKWYFNGVELPGQTSRELLAPEDGVYEVEVTQSTCVKKSAAREYSITAIENKNLLHQLYPNPTRDKVIVTLPEPIDFASVRVVSMIGQVLQIPVTKISDHSAEVDLAEVQAGFYLLQVNGQRYKVLKK